ncbi:MAG: hypothetical protein M3M85_00905 [bacterium]|nr:hypothetical protein [bacterium]
MKKRIKEGQIGIITGSLAGLLRSNAAELPGEAVDAVLDEEPSVLNEMYNLFRRRVERHVVRRPQLNEESQANLLALADELGVPEPLRLAFCESGGVMLPGD